MAFLLLERAVVHHSERTHSLLFVKYFMSFPFSAKYKFSIDDFISFNSNLKLIEEIPNNGEEYYFSGTPIGLLSQIQSWFEL